MIFINMLLILITKKIKHTKHSYIRSSSLVFYINCLLYRKLDIAFQLPKIKTNKLLHFSEQRHSDNNMPDCVFIVESECLTEKHQAHYITY